MHLPYTTAVRASARTILLKVSPAPSNLAERRAILHMLKKYANVEYFKRLNDPSHFISIVSSTYTASRLVEQSPLEFDYVPEQQQQQRMTSNTPDKPSPDTPTTSTETRNPACTFLVKIIEKPDYAHRTRIRNSQLYGRWPQHDGLFQQDSATRAALCRSVPGNIDFDGLADWESFGQADEDEAPSSMLINKRHFVQVRRMRKSNDGAGFESLVEMWNARHGGGEGRVGVDGGKGIEEAEAGAAVTAGEWMAGVELGGSTGKGELDDAGLDWDE